MKISLNSAFKNLIKLSAVGAIATMSFSSVATSPVPNQFERPNMISSHSFTQESYQEIEQAKMFPKPTENQVQHILSLSKRDDEASYKVEIQIGQNKMVDCNQHRLMGEIEKQNLQGWGYSYYTLDKLTDGPSTMMMCREPKTAKFVTLGESITIDYDSRLPKVFYLPEGAELRYRIWQVKSDYQYTGNQ
ncbi:serine protease inhibitor ecotin [Shewanella sp. 10N.286.51.B7]|uniref:serine protease inhibitor ecotin n=1 Tax=Shewanella sp. 10N.286.51.B7 TaxID=1880836 RepID=UPI000C81773F|nr:serine protease inhibitor ecotin [Shewanella sp. 10N.286.51.B7]